MYLLMFLCLSEVSFLLYMVCRDELCVVYACEFVHHMHADPAHHAMPCLISYHSIHIKYCLFGNMVGETPQVSRVK